MSRNQGRYNPTASKAADFFSTAIVRVVVFACGLALLRASYVLSVDGFGFRSPNHLWIGQTLGAAIIAMEMAFQKYRSRNNATIVVLGLLSYAYGIYTNYLGMWLGVGAPAWESPGGYETNMFAWVVGILMELAPEPMIMFGLFGPNQEGDFVGSVMDVIGGLRMGDVALFARRQWRNIWHGLRTPVSEPGRGVETSRTSGRGSTGRERGVIIPSMDESYAAIKGPEAYKLYCEWNDERREWVFYKRVGDGDDDWEEAYALPSGEQLLAKLRDQSYGWISQTEFNERYGE